MQANTQPAFFKQGPKPFSLLLIYASISLVLLFVDGRWQWLQPVRNEASVVLHSVQWLVTTPVSLAHTVSEFFVTQTQLQQENRRLQDERLIANSQLLRMQELIMENTQLKQLLSTLEVDRGKGVLTEVLYTDRDPWSAKLVVDKGSLANVKPGFVVIDAQGVIGQVTRVEPLTSEVTLVTHKNQAVPVQVLRNGLRAVVFGAGRERPMQVSFMPLNSDIREGDQLVTSGIDGTYPAGLPVAKVSRVDRSAGSAFAQVACEPIAGVDKNRYFLILNERRILPPEPEPIKPPTAPAAHGRGKHKGTD